MNLMWVVAHKCRDYYFSNQGLVITKKLCTVKATVVHSSELNQLSVSLSIYDLFSMSSKACNMGCD